MLAEALMRRAVSRDLFAPSAGSEQEEHFDGGQHKLFLKHYPVISGSVTVVDTKGTVDATDDEDLDADLWRLDPEAGTVARVTANGSRRIFDDGVRRWKVKYRGGMDQEENWVTIQAALKESIHRLVSHWYNDPGRTAADPRGREKEREIVPEDIVGAWENYGEALA
jgi:hypothetical protein